MLNCICIYKLNKNYKCYDKGNYVEFPAKRLTADAWSIIINDYYNRPLPERPYYYIHNVNQSNNLPTNVYDEDIPGSTDQYWIGNENNTGYKSESEYPREISIKKDTSTINL
jgi:hypothetical protein